MTSKKSPSAYSNMDSEKEEQIKPRDSCCSIQLILKISMTELKLHALVSKTKGNKDPSTA